MMALKKFFGLTTISGIIIFLSLYQAAQAALDISEEEKWPAEECATSEVICEDETWSGNVVFSDPKKPVIVADGATLTIEPGTTVAAFKIQVSLGRIVANGTPQKKIVFTKAHPILPEGCSAEGVPMGASGDSEENGGWGGDCAVYCPYSSGQIEFQDYSRLYGMEPSIFNYVEFREMGINRPQQGCYSEVTVPAFKLDDGQVRIENSSFIANHYVDVSANIGYVESWGNRPAAWKLSIPISATIGKAML